MSQGGAYFKLDPTSGRFFYYGEVGLGGSPGDGTCIVIGGPSMDLHAIAQLLNANIAAPTTGGRWQVTVQALLTAQNTGVKAALVPTTA